MFRLSEKFGWTEKEIEESSFRYINSILKIIRIEVDYKNWQQKKYGNRK